MIKLSDILNEMDGASIPSLTDTPPKFSVVKKNKKEKKELASKNEEYEATKDISDRPNDKSVKRGRLVRRKISKKLNTLN